MNSALQLIKARDPFDGVSPRTRLACKLYATGAARTKREASIRAGMHPESLNTLSNSSPKVKMYLQELEAKMEAGTIETSQALSVLAKRAIMKMATLMEHSDRQDIQLKAATELADRSPETQKTQQLQTTSLTIGAQDAKELARVLVESARHREQFAHVAREGLVEVDIDTPPLTAGGQDGEGSRG